MARSRAGIKGTNRRRIRQRDQDSDESDEEYKVTDDEDFDESDECYSLDGDESEEISTDFGKSKRVSRSRNARRTSGKKVNESKKPRKRRRVSYTEDDKDDEVADEDDEEFLPWDWEANQGNKPMEKKRVSYTAYTEVDDDDDDDDYTGGGGDDEEEDYKESVFSGRNRKQRAKPQEKKRVVYTEDEEEEEEEVEDDAADEEEEEKEEEVADEDDEEFMSLDREANQVYTPIEKNRDSFTEVDDDSEECKEFVPSGRIRKQRNKPREKKRVVYTEEEDDDEEEEVADEDDAEFTSLGGKANQIKTPREMKKGSYKEADNDDDVDDVGGDDDDYAEFVSSGRKRNQTKKPQGKKVVYTEDDEDGDGDGDEDDVGDDDDDDEEEEDDDYAEFVSSGRKRNQTKKPQGKKVVYTEDDEDDDDDDDDDDEFMYSGRNVNQKKNLREKREVSYTEDDDDDSGFMSTNRNRNQINKRREKRIVSYKEEDEEEDENDAEFELSDSDFVDDEDETPKIKQTKVTRYHTQKKSVRGRQKNSKKLKIKNPTKPKQSNHRSGQKLGTSKEKSLTNKTKMENQNKISKRRKHRADWQRPMESDSDFVNSESSDHEYTISEEEREQMREAKVYCANLRAKLRSSSFGNQEKQPTYEQKKYPIRKGKEKIEDVKDDIGKQVCGICLSEEQKRTMRGVLNCCRHYFCFSCIMEWSKVESRCPLCKQRFTTITKTAKSDTGFDLRTVVVPVPECDQVYEPSEEELRGYLDPYESVICTECQNGGDDALMLLCDICDSSAHTFCVGLGREVPEGNWYCEGCRPTVFGTLNSDRRLSNNAPDLSSSSPTPGDFDLNELYVPETPLTQQTRVPPEPIPASTGTSATTLRDRRRLHRQIHHLGLLNNNRVNDLVGRSSGASASSSGIRLFGSQLDQARVSVSQNDHIFPSMHDPSGFYPRTDQFSVQVQNSNMASADSPVH